MCTTICCHHILTHWGRATHICVGKLTIIGSDNGLSPGPRKAIIWTNAGILLIGPLGTNFNEFVVEIHTFSFKKMHLKMSSGKWRLFCLGLNVLRNLTTVIWCMDVGPDIHMPPINPEELDIWVHYCTVIYMDIQHVISGQTSICIDKNITYSYIVSPFMKLKSPVFQIILIKDMSCVYIN